MNNRRLLDVELAVKPNGPAQLPKKRRPQSLKPGPLRLAYRKWDFGTSTIQTPEF